MVPILLGRAATIQENEGAEADILPALCPQLFALSSHE
jgi:hypothetical protein